VLFVLANVEHNDIGYDEICSVTSITWLLICVTPLSGIIVYFIVVVVVVVVVVVIVVIFTVVLCLHAFMYLMLVDYVSK
jgi:hypothetical protein